MNLVDELTQKQAHKFQLNDFDIVFIKKTLCSNKEGIFNLNSKIEEKSVNSMLNYMKEIYKNYTFELSKDLSNYEIMFREKMEKRW